MITTPKWFGEFKKGYIHLDNNLAKEQFNDNNS